MTEALIDGDIIVYKIGFACDSTYYTVGKKKFKLKKSAVNWCYNKGINESEITKHHEPGDLDNVERQLDFFIRGILSDVDADTYKMFLTGENNFREEVATTAKYKGNRDASHKPHHMLYIRDYLLNEWGANVVHGIEADDALGIHQHDDSIICSIDKDLKMIPGWHYNWDKKEFEQISEFEGDRNFCKQLLTGDKTDNIIGIKGIADKTALKKLQPYTSYKDMLCMVGREYSVVFDNPEERLDENGKLLWIMREENDIWHLGR